MPVLREQLEARLGIDEAFEFIADFANAARWDPGTETSVRVNPGPVAVGARYRLGVRMAGRVAPMEYEIVELRPNERVVLRGEGSGVKAVDEISFRPAANGTAITYVADIRLTGLMRLIEPFAGGAFKRLGTDAREGMRRTLEELADGGPKPSSPHAER